MKIKDSVRKKVLTALLIGTALTGAGVSKSFAASYSNPNNVQYASRAASDKLIKKLEQINKSRAVTLHIYKYHEGQSNFRALVYGAGDLYAFGKDNLALMGAVDIDGSLFYFRPSDLTGVKDDWVNINDNFGHHGRYYFNYNYMAMTEGFRHIRNQDYLFGADKTIQTGFHNVGIGTYYMKPKTGERVTGWYTIGGNRRFFDPRRGGDMKKGWYADTGGMMYFYSNSGVMAPEGVSYIDDNSDWDHKPGKYLFLRHGNGTNTYIDYGFYNDHGWRYFFSPLDSGRALQDQWYVPNGGRSTDKNGVMYFDSEGHMAKGVTKIDGETYVFTHKNKRDDNYYRDYGWYTDKSTNKRYYSSDGVSARSATNSRETTPMGAAVTGKQIIDGKTYQFDSNGALIK